MTPKEYADGLAMLKPTGRLRWLNVWGNNPLRRIKIKQTLQQEMMDMRTGKTSWFDIDIVDVREGEKVPE